MLTLLMASAFAAELDCEPLFAQQARNEFEGQWGATAEVAQDIVDRFERQLTCSGPIDPYATARLYQEAAIIASGSGNAQLATKWLQRAAELAPDHAPDPRRGPTDAVLNTWQVLAQHQRTDKPSLVKVRSPVFLDGRPLKQGTTVMVPPGDRLLQLPTPQGLVTRRLRLDASQSYKVGKPQTWRIATVVTGSAMVAGGAAMLLASRPSVALGYAGTEIDEDLVATSNALAISGSVIGAVGLGVAAFSAFYQPGGGFTASATVTW